MAGKRTGRKGILCRIGLGAMMLTLPGTAWAAPSVSSTNPPAEAVVEKPAASLENQSTQEGTMATDARFTLQKIQVDVKGLELDAAALEKETAEFCGHEITMQELNTALQKITAYCRRHGYPAAAAYLPSQKSQQGVLQVKLLPGTYGEIRLENGSRLKDDTAKGLMHGLNTGEIIRAKGLETVLYNLTGLGGIQAAGLLNPGKEVGSSDLTIRLKDGRQASYILYSENYGSTTSGRYRYGLQAVWPELARVGDSLRFTGLVSNHDLKNYSLSCELPVGHDGTKAGLSMSRMDYELGGVLRMVGAKGKADTISLYAATPLWQTYDSSQFINYGLDYRALSDELASYGYHAKKHSYAFHAGVSGMQRSGRGILNYDLTASTGTLGMDSDYARLLDSYSHTSGRYTKAVLNLNGQYGIDERWDVQLRFQGQKASRDLDSSEEIYLGGANAVRAYPQGEGSGDEGWQGTIELRFHTGLPGLSLSTYFDSGHVRLAKDGTSGGETLQGWGIGVTYSQPGSWFARFDYARRIGLCANASEEAKAHGRMWFMIGKVW